MQHNELQIGATYLELYIMSLPALWTVRVFLWTSDNCDTSIKPLHVGIGSEILYKIIPNLHSQFQVEEAWNRAPFQQKLNKLASRLSYV